VPTFPRRLLRLAVAIGLVGAVVPALPACGGGGEAKTRTKTKNDKKAQNAKQLLQQARAAAAKNDVDRADVLYRQAFKEDRKFSILEEHVHFLIDAHHPGKAVEVAKLYYDEETADTQGFALYAEALIEANQAKAALEVTEGLLQLDDASAQAHALRGRALVLDGQRDDGIDELRKALQLDSRDPKVVMALGEALHKAGKVDEAALQLRSAVKLDPENPRAYTLLGAALRDQKEIDDAKAALREAVRLDPDNSRAYFELGIMHNQLSENADAEQALGKAVELDPEDSTYWYAYGQILWLRAVVDNKVVDPGKLDKAINAYRRALEIHPPHPKASGKLVMALVDADRHDDAEVMLTGMLRADPDNAQSYYYLGVVYAHAKKYKLAIDAYEKYMELGDKRDPERDRVKKAILDLKRKL
jgi:cytochrome c-type biogenesis protein CcmH/NrfG